MPAGLQSWMLTALSEEQLGNVQLSNAERIMQGAHPVHLGKKIYIRAVLQDGMHTLNAAMVAGFMQGRPACMV